MELLVIAALMALRRSRARDVAAFSNGQTPRPRERQA